MKSNFLLTVLRAPLSVLGGGALTFATLTTPTHATPQNVENWGVCDRAAAQAAHETGVPLNILLGITRVETGRGRDGTIQPWPWTVNIEGTGAWFDTHEQALDHVLERQAAGARSFDIGCFQINHRWHGEHFSSISEMFDPVENARYAAQFLTSLHREFGSWNNAIGAYHSRTARHAARYLGVFERHVADLGPLPSTLGPVLESTIDVARMSSDLTNGASLPDAASPAARENTFPLIQPNEGASQSIGSLVPLSNIAFASPAGG